jgi:ATP-dependent helicase/nuclease subunit A
MSDQLPLFDALAAADPVLEADESARAFATDPARDVVLEASAGTGKTTVLVSRYLNLLRAGVDPRNILAITFTRKAAAEMRERIVQELRVAARGSRHDRAVWTMLRDRLPEIAITTIDAFCLSLLHEFPLEADLDPGFDLADETEVARLVDEALDHTLRIGAATARENPDVAVLIAQLGQSRLRDGLALLLQRRLVAWEALDRFLVRGPRNQTAEDVCRRAAGAVQDALAGIPGGLARFIEDGPAAHPRFRLLARDLQGLPQLAAAPNAAIRGALDRVREHFLTQDGQPRAGGSIKPFSAAHCRSADAWRRHRDTVKAVAPAVKDALLAFNRDLNAVLARGVRHMFAIALAEYRRALERHSALDFSEVLARALDLLRRMDEFAQSRFRLDRRYQHVLVDEFQDTSRAQWELISLVIKSWGEGEGLAYEGPLPPSIFIVGDRKQSIYRFRDADVGVVDEAAAFIEGLRPGGRPRRSIARSFRAAPELQAFVNDVFAAIEKGPPGPDAFRYDEQDRFPSSEGHTDAPVGGICLGVSVGPDPETCAEAVAAEIVRVLRDEPVRDRRTGLPRPARPGDVAILFRSRASHREFESALEGRGIPAYVYKGLGFFDADEIKDISALLRYLADPHSNLRAAAFLRSGFVRVSDEALARLAPNLAAALMEPAPAELAGTLAVDDCRVLDHTRRAFGAWRTLVDRIPPAELLDQILRDTAYLYEIRGPRMLQARENIKKIRGLVRRIQNRGYPTLARIAEHLDRLSAGDEPNAVLEALDAVNLMTVHAAKGLEFPVVFLVNIAKGTGGIPPAVKLVTGGATGVPSVSVGPFVSDADERERVREREETKRLLYVALTRARDRLYLSSVLKNGALAPGPGSLVEVVPDGLRQVFADAAAAAPASETLSWRSGSGRSYLWRICRPSRHAETGASSGRPLPPPPDDDFLGRPSTGAIRVAATGWIAGSNHPETARAGGGDPGHDAERERIVGRLVHRLFQMGVGLGDPLEEVNRRARSLLRPGEELAVEDASDVVAAASQAFQRIAARGDIVAMLEAGQKLHEVPFSLCVADIARERATIVRGTIDCLVRLPDGNVVVIELKTGRPDSAHERQLDLYVRATRAMYPQAAVSGLLVYI